MSAADIERDRLARLRVDTLHELERLTKEQMRHYSRAKRFDYLIMCCRATIADVEKQLSDQQ